MTPNRIQRGVRSTPSTLGLPVSTVLYATHRFRTSCAHPADCQVGGLSCRSVHTCQAPVREHSMAAIPRLVVAAPSSGHGKTAVAVGMIAAFAARGLTTAGFKI